MAFHFFDWLRSKREFVDVATVTLESAAREFQIRQVAFWTCVNMVAAAFGRCEFKTFRNGQEVREREYYTWNVAPNRNQNSTAFIHELVAKAYKENEVLMVSEPYGSGVVVAKDWRINDDGPTNYYTDVDLGVKDRKIKRLDEREVLHLNLYQKDMEKVIGALNDSYLRLVRAAMENYIFNTGQHWKVEIGRLAQDQDDFTGKFQEIITKQIKPFLTETTAILPQFEGYKYSQISGGGEKKIDSAELRSLTEDIFNFTARGFLIPAVLVNGKVEGTEDANSRFMSFCIDPLADQLAEEINRKRYTFDEWRRGSYVQIDTSAILHFDMFKNAANVEKLIGSGAWSVNEVRRAAGYPLLTEPWADEHFLTLNISTMTDTMGGNRKGVNDK